MTWVSRSARMRIAIVVVLAACGGGSSNWLEGTEPPPGEIAAYDPIAALPAVTQFAGPAATLVGMEVAGVRSSGTLELEAAYYPNASYRFVRPASSKSELPVGARPSGAFELVTVKVSKATFVEQNGGSLLDRGMSKYAIATDRPPATTTARCTLGALWREAINRGAPGDAVAKIALVDGRWTFDIIGTRFHFDFDGRCVLAAPSTEPAAAAVAPTPAVEPR